MTQSPPPLAVAIALGMVLTAVLSATLAMASLKAGIMPGVSPLLILLAWGVFAKHLRSSRASRLLSWTQVAGSAGVAVATGVVFTAPLLPVLRAERARPSLREYVQLERAQQPGLQSEGSLGERGDGALEIEAARAQLLAAAPGMEVTTLIWMSLAGAAIGFGFVGLSAKRFLSDPNLPAPEANVCKTLTLAAIAHPEQRPRLLPSLGLGILAGCALPIAKALGFASQALVLLPLWPNARGLRHFSNSDGSRNASVELHLVPIYLGIGALLHFSTALLLFSGSALHALSAVLFAGIEPDSPFNLRFPSNSPRWIGGAAMSVAVVWSLIKFGLEPRRPQPTQKYPFKDKNASKQGLSKNQRGWKASSNDGLGCKALEFSMSSRQSALNGYTQKSELSPSLALLEVSRRERLWLLASILFGSLLLGVWIALHEGATPLGLASFSMFLALAAVMVTLGALLSLQIGSSASPVSGTVLVSSLVLCAVALILGRRQLTDVEFLAPLLVAICVAVCAANDSSQDYKTLQLCGIPPREGFLAQGLGLAVGVLVVPFTVHVAHQAYVFGSPELPAPQGSLFATIVDAVLLRSDLPWWPVEIGLALGAVAVWTEIQGARRGLILPAMAFAVGLYLPPPIGFGMLLGALARRLARGAGEQSSEGVLCAAGLITGSALLDLFFGVGILSLPGFDPGRSLHVYSLPAGLSYLCSALLLLFCLLALVRNSRAK